MFKRRGRGLSLETKRDEKLLSKGILVERIQNEGSKDITKLSECLKSIIGSRALFITNNKANEHPSLIA